MRVFEMEVDAQVMGVDAHENEKRASTICTASDSCSSNNDSRNRTHGCFTPLKLMYSHHLLNLPHPPQTANAHTITIGVI